MFIPKRLAALMAAVGVLAAGAPVAGAAPGPKVGSPYPSPATFGYDSANACLTGMYDPGPLGPSGPYGANGPWGPNGPMHASPNPLGNVAGCGGAAAFLLRGGTIASFVGANIAAVGR
jgi:hypothetical protein